MWWASFSKFESQSLAWNIEVLGGFIKLYVEVVLSIVINPAFCNARVNLHFRKPKVTKKISF